MNHNEEIARLLEQAESPSQRATLLVLLQIGSSLASIDKAFGEHRSEFDNHRAEFRNHVTDEQRLLNRGLGAWAFLCAVLVTALSFAGWYVGQHILRVNEQQQVIIDANSNRLTAIETLLRELKMRPAP